MHIVTDLFAIIKIVPKKKILLLRKFFTVFGRFLQLIKKGNRIMSLSVKANVCWFLTNKTCYTMFLDFFAHIG